MSDTRNMCIALEKFKWVEVDRYGLSVVSDLVNQEII